MATYAAEKANQLGAKVLTLSDSSGFIHDPDGIDPEKLEFVKELKDVRRGRISEYADKFSSATFHADKRPWAVDCDVAFPCATQNEVNLDDAKNLTKNNVLVVCEGANMPTETRSDQPFNGKRSSVRSRQSCQCRWSGGFRTRAKPERVAAFLVTRRSEREAAGDYEKTSTRKCVKHGSTGALPNDNVDYVTGANVAGFIKVADAMVRLRCRLSCIATHESILRTSRSCRNFLKPKEALGN